MTNAVSTFLTDLIALANEVGQITGNRYVVTLTSGAPVFTIVDERGLPVVENLTEEDLIADAVEVLDLADAVAADPETYHPDTRANYGVETAAETAAREQAEAEAWAAEIDAERLAEIDAAREREARSEYAYAASEAIYGPSDPDHLPW